MECFQFFCAIEIRGYVALYVFRYVSAIFQLVVRYHIRRVFEHSAPTCALVVGVSVLCVGSCCVSEQLLVSFALILSKLPFGPVLERHEFCCTDDSRLECRVQERYLIFFNDSR